MKRIHFILTVGLVACLGIGLWWGWVVPDGRPQERPLPIEQVAAPASTRQPGRAKAAEGGRQRPPTFLRAGSGEGVITDPRAPGYDPYVLAKAGVAEPEIFAAEPRNPGWATPMEANLTRLIERDLAALAPAAKLTAVECRTLSCKIAVGGNDGALKVAASVLQIGAMARLMRFGNNAKGQGEFDVTLIMDGEVRDPKDWVRLVGESRRRHLAVLRSSGKKPLYDLAAVPAQEMGH